MSETKAGRELDALIEEVVMGTPKALVAAMALGPREYSADMDAAWHVVLRVQRLNPGWRFLLLGGDVRMGYKADRAGKLLRDSDGLVVDPASRFPFGWRAEFFGEMDPRIDTGNRHGEAQADTAPLAICLAALAAMGATHAR